MSNNQLDFAFFDLRIRVAISLIITFVIAIQILCISLSTLDMYTNYYSKIEKGQLRETVKEVIEANKGLSLIFSYYARHYNYNFTGTQRLIHPESLKCELEPSKVDYVSTH